MNSLYLGGSRQSHYVVNNDNDYCNECNTNILIECCNRCGEAVCANDQCSTIFPHHKNSMFAICRTCYIKIERRLTLQIDIDKLRNLKNKISSSKQVIKNTNPK